MRRHLIDLLHELVRQLLHFGRVLALLVLADHVVFFEFLQHVHAVAAHIAHADAGVLGILVRELDQMAHFSAHRPLCRELDLLP